MSNNNHAPNYTMIGLEPQFVQNSPDGKIKICEMIKIHIII